MGYYNFKQSFFLRNQIYQSQIKNYELQLYTLPLKFRNLLKFERID